MISPRMRDLVVSLRKRTMEGAVDWKETDKEETFAVAFSPYSLTVHREEEHPKKRISLCVFNGGKLLDETDNLNTAEGPPAEVSECLPELLTKARDTALGIQKAMDEIMRCLEKGPTNSTLQIVQATYGAGHKVVNVTQELRSRITDGTLTIKASNGIAGDPYFGALKQLKLRYRFEGNEREIVIKEGESVKLP